jgi:hypothetical protein
MPNHHHHQPLLSTTTTLARTTATTTLRSLNITAITVLPEVEGDEEEFKGGWGAVVLVMF